MITNYVKFSVQKLLLVSLSALLYILTYPGNNYSLLAWIALIPWFLALDKNSWKLNTLLSFIFSGTIYLVYLWMPYHYAIFSIFDNLFLGTTLIFVHLFSYTLPFVIFGSLYHYFNSYKLRDSIYLASLFTILSMGLPTLFTYNIATSLYNYPLLLQVLDISGISLLLWSIVVVNLSLKNMLLLLWENNIKKDFLKNTFLVIAVFSFILFYAYWHLNMKSEEEQKSKITIATIQPNMANNLHELAMIRDNTKSTALSHIELTRKALASNKGIDLIVWPEGGLVVNCENRVILKKLSKFTQETKTPLLYQCNQTIDDVFYNQSRYIGATGQLENRYNKQNLIPFFEYIPKVFEINLIDKKFYNELFFKKGQNDNLFHHHNVNIIPSICYDAHSHELIRKGLNLKGNLLVIQSNDLIFKKSYTGLFDTAINIVTAISFRVPMVKSSNSGYGVFLSSSGEVLENSLTPPNQKHVSVNTVEIRDTFSFYRGYGDWFFWLSFIFVIFHFLIKKNILISITYKAK